MRQLGYSLEEKDKGKALEACALLSHVFVIGASILGISWHLLADSRPDASSNRLTVHY